jgi:hypothetical protein
MKRIEKLITSFLGASAHFEAAARTLLGVLAYELFKLIPAFRLPGRLGHVKNLLRLSSFISRSHPLRICFSLLSDAEQGLSRVLISLVVAIEVLHDVLSVGTT